MAILSMIERKIQKIKCNLQKWFDARNILFEKWVEICAPKLTFRGAGFYNDNNKS